MRLVTVFTEFFYFCPLELVLLQWALDPLQCTKTAIFQLDFDFQEVGEAVGLPNLASGPGAQERLCLFEQKIQEQKMRFQCILSWHEMGRTAVLIVSSECSPSGTTVCYCTSQLCQSYLRGRIHSVQPDESLKKIK